MKLSAGITILAALLCISTAAALAETETEKYLQRAAASYTRGELADAEKLLDKALTGDSESREAKALLVQVLLEQSATLIDNEKFEEALVPIRKALLLAPKNPSVQRLASMIGDALGISIADIEEEPKASSVSVAKKEPAKPAQKVQPKTKPAQPAQVSAPQMEASSVLIVRAGESKIAYIAISLAVLSILVILLYGWYLLSRTKSLAGTAQDIKRQLESGQPWKKQIEESSNNTQEELKRYWQKTKDTFEELFDARWEQERERMEQLLADKTKHSEETLRRELEDILARCANIVGDLRENLEAQPDSQLRVISNRVITAAANLYKYDATKALSTLRKLSKDKDPWVRINLVWALEKMDEPEPLEIGIGMLDDPDSRVQREVLKMLKSKSTNPGVQADARQRLEEMLKRIRRERGWII